jgi:hypothetical protein
MDESRPTIWPQGPIWHHTRVRWWAVLLRQLGLMTSLPPWAMWRCTAVWPRGVCGCGMYSLDWSQATWEGEDNASKE